jgi:tetratricopeptide (TPR) repeat protein
MKLTINYKAVLILLASAGVLVTAVHFLHAFQMERNAQAVLEQARQAEQEGEWQHQAEYLSTYLGLVPTDADARGTYALLLRKQAKSRETMKLAYEQLESALLRAPQREDLRRAALDLALLGFGQIASARHHLDILLKAHPNDRDLMRRSGLCEGRAGKYAEAVAWYEKALGKDSHQGTASTASADTEYMDACLELAGLYLRQLNQPTKARETIKRMVKVYPESASAHLAAARFYVETGNFKDAENEVQVVLLREALAVDAWSLVAQTQFRRFIAPGPAPYLLGVAEYAITADLRKKPPETWLLAAELARLRQNPKYARDLLEKGQEANLEDGRFGQSLALLDLSERRPEEARGHLRHSLEHPPKRAEELWALGNTLLDAGDTAGVAQVMKLLPPGRDSGAFTTYLEARLLMKEQVWGKARLLLEKVRASKASYPDLIKHVNGLLAECHGRLGNPDEQITASRRALEKDRDWAPARRQLASGLLANGQLDQAIEEYRRLASRYAELRTDLVRVLIARNLSLPTASRDWREVEGLLAVRGRKPTMAEELLRAEVLLAKGDLNKARGLIEAQRKLDPKQPEPWLALVRLSQRQLQAGGVLALIDKAEKATGHDVEWALARARHWAGEQPPQREQGLKEVLTSIDQYPAKDRGRLAGGLAPILAAVGDIGAAESLWRREAEAEPQNLGVRLLLLERAVEARNQDWARELQTQIQQIEGLGGYLGPYTEAALLVDQARREGSKAVLPSAQEHLAQVAALRPSWPRVSILAAQIFELQGRRDKALEKYRLAIEQGDRRLPVLGRTLQLMYEQGLYAEATRLLRTVPEEAHASPLLAPVAVQLNLAAGDDDGNKKRALELARKAVDKAPNDFRLQLWFGEAAAQSDKPKEAEDAFRKACALAPKVPGTWVALILFLAQTNKVEAEAQLREAQKVLPPATAALALAPCYEALGRVRETAASLQKALEAAPNDPGVLFTCAAFYVRTGQQAKAEPLLRQVLEAPPGALTLEARRELAMIIAGRGAKGFREALALLEENARTGGDSIFDKRVKGLILSTRADQRREAIALLESSTASDSTAPPGLRYLLAGLHEADGNWPLASAHLRALAREHPDTTSYRGGLVRGLLRHGEVAEARKWLDDSQIKTEEQSPESLELQAHVLKAENKAADAVGLVVNYASQKGARLDFAAALFEELGANAQAEQLYRSRATDPTQPESKLALVRFLGRQGKLSEALDLWDKEWATSPPAAMAQCGVAIVRTEKATAEQRRRVESRLKAAWEKRPDDLLCTLLLAELFEIQGQAQEAMSLYRKLLEREPNNLVALNNLAYLLAVAGTEPEEARARITAAVEEYGPLPALLDTRAVVYLKEGQTDLALKDLEQAVRGEPTPAKYFHLAQAQRLKKNREAAAKAFQEGKDAGLKPSVLHSLEGGAFDELRNWLYAGQTTNLKN